MKIQIISDLHLEFKPFLPALHKYNRDILIIAGDLHVGISGVEFLSNEVCITPVLYVLGNHEFYNHHYADIVKFWQNTPLNNLYFLQNSKFVQENCRFLGTTLWTDVNHGNKIDLQNARRGLNDFTCIQYQDHVFTPEDSMQLYKRNRIWLKEQLQKPFSGKTVVITHHLPSKRSIDPQFANSPLNPVFFAHCEDLITEFQPDLWIHGHTHSSCDYKIGNTRILCNPLGYPKETNPNFKSDLIIQI